MADALSELGYIADHFAPGPNLARFRANLLACLRSQLPVILLMHKRCNTGDGKVSTGHAVTATGYSDPGGVANIPYMDRAPVPLRSADATILYVHDDNLGSHAHYELFESPGGQHQMLRRGRLGNTKQWWHVDEWQIYGALVPKPDKLRLPLPTLVEIIIQLRQLLALAFPGIELSYETRVNTGVEYQRALLDFVNDAPSLTAFYTRVGLPRFVAVVSVYEEDEHVCDVLVDVSEVERNPPMPNLLAFIAPSVPQNSPGGLHLLQLAKYFDAPVLLRPQAPPPTSPPAGTPGTP